MLELGFRNAWGLTNRLSLGNAYLGQHLATAYEFVVIAGSITPAQGRSPHNLASCWISQAKFMAPAGI